MRFKYFTDVKTSKEKAWDLVINFERRTEWLHFYQSSKIIHKTQNWIGTTFKEQFVFLNIPITAVYKIVEYQHLKSWKAESNTFPFKPKIEGWIEALEGGVIRSHLVFELSTKGAFRFIPKSLIQSQIDELVTPCLTSYAAILESA